MDIGGVPRVRASSKDKEEDVSIITVGSTTALMSALSSAHAGDTIKLQAGQYDGLAIKNLTFSQDVTITSADPLHQAVLTNFNVSHVTGLTISNVNLYANGPVGPWDFTVSYSNDVHFDHVSIHGSLDGTAADDANGIIFENSTNVSLTNSQLQQLGHGAAAQNSSNVQFSGNFVHDLRCDGFDFVTVDHLTVNGNAFTSFHPAAGDHADAIQMWTAGTTTSHDVTINNNVVTLGSGTGSHGIFLRASDPSLPFQNVTVSGNLIDGANDPNGINVTYANGLTVSNNTLTSSVGGPRVQLILDHVNNGVLTNNQAVMFVETNDTNLTETNDRLNNVMTDNGNTVLASWLHAHGEDSLYSSLQTAVSNVAESVLGGPNLATVSTTSQQTLTCVTVMNNTDTSFTLNGGGDGTVFIGNNLNDSITGTSAANQIYGLDGNDTINGYGGADTLVGGNGDDVYIVPNSLATIVEAPGGGNDTVMAMGNYTLGANLENLTLNGTGNWKATGNELNNVIVGNAGTNVLDGGLGNDTLSGGAGADTLIGGAGNDRLTGGVGADTFRFAPGSGHDVITDFGLGGEKDVIDISAFKSAGLTPTVHDVGSDLVISFTNGDSITVLGVHTSSLIANATGWVF
jgi:Ca2+-binding RTX toxin-like protein